MKEPTNDNVDWSSLTSVINHAKLLANMRQQDIVVYRLANVEQYAMTFRTRYNVWHHRDVAYSVVVRPTSHRGT